MSWTRRLFLTNMALLSLNGIQANSPQKNVADDLSRVLSAPPESTSADASVIICNSIAFMLVFPASLYFNEDNENNALDTPRWPSPAYPGLIGNVLPDLETYDYLRGFTEVYFERGDIRLNTEVVRVEELEDGKGWNVTTRDWRSPDGGEICSEVWDAVVVCTGWYNDPLWPGTPGMEDLKKKDWRYTLNGIETAQRALIIGNGNSANALAVVPAQQTT
ncbi:hypothetical protein BT96DRAFT_1004239 [Gymnopus androsaceus JB14]|uniref:FAD/NAD(P)-binding domain-containing protein n=1 Tax=Gymnopus androsaceus JB14 TaxID=1447944 RepID=A0A6A4GSK1_9AGAR|nr:hypothetical protein BT96DRAFT_1004239 [Gymnopus androsaceus JB14]